MRNFRPGWFDDSEKDNFFFGVCEGVSARFETFLTRTFIAKVDLPVVNRDERFRRWWEFRSMEKEFSEKICYCPKDFSMLKLS